MSAMDVLLTPSAEHLDLDGHRLAHHPSNDRRQFPDGEVYVQLPDVESDQVALVHAGQPHPNRGLAYLYGDMRGYSRGINRAVAYEKGALDELKRLNGKK